MLIRRALDVRRRVLPGNHPDLASTIGALGTYHEHRGEFDRARILLQEAIAVFKTPAERHHPKAIALMGEYASLLGSLNANRENEAVLRDAISLARATLGTDTITTADLINDLGVSLATQGRHADAEAAFREAFHPHLRLAGEHHWRTRNTARNIGRVLALQQRYAEALPWLDRAIAARIPTEPADDTGRMGIRAQRAAVWFRLGHQDAAIAELTRIVEALPKARNAQADTVEAWTRILLARALNDAGHPARAEQALLPARKWFERTSRHTRGGLKWHANWGGRASFSTRTGSSAHPSRAAWPIIGAGAWPSRRSSRRSSGSWPRQRRSHSRRAERSSRNAVLAWRRRSQRRRGPPLIRAVVQRAKRPLPARRRQGWA